VSGIKILVAEDEPLAALELKESLESMGCVVVATVSSGEAAVAAAMTHRPDLVIMDINLRSFIDGIDAAERLSFASRIPVIYITAYQDRAMRERAMKTTPIAYLLKPLDLSELKSAVGAVVTKE